MRFSLGVIVLKIMMLLLFSSCSSKSKSKNQAALPEGNVEVEEETDSKIPPNNQDPTVATDTTLALSPREIRTGHQYIASVARLLNLKQSDFPAYNEVKTSLAVENSASPQTIHEGLWSSATLVATEGCRKFIPIHEETYTKQNKTLTAELLAKDLSQNIFIDQVEAGLVQKNVLDLATLATSEPDKKLLVCTALATSLLIY